MSSADTPVYPVHEVSTTWSVVSVEIKDYGGYKDSLLTVSVQINDLTGLSKIVPQAELVLRDAYGVYDIDTGTLVVNATSHELLTTKAWYDKPEVVFNFRLVDYESRA